MKRILPFIIIAAALLTAGCGGEGKRHEKMTAALDSINKRNQPLADDKSIYGLACDGCSDTVVYLLQADGSDPVKFNILNATKRGHVFGSLAIGNNIAVVPNAKDSTVADFVIDLDDLKGTWCYTVLPELRVSEDATDADRQRLMREMPDSLKELYFVEREYGFTLKRQYAASPVGMFSDNNIGEESPVMYPPCPLYNAWHMLNGRLVLTRLEAQKQIEDIKEAKTFNDTCDIVLMEQDSLVLRCGDNIRSYYRLNDAKQANRLANKKAEEQKKMTEKKMTEGN